MEIESWGRMPELYREVVALEIPRARGEGMERVVVYEVIQPEGESN